MELTEELKKRIDDMTYKQMLSRVRFAPIGDPLFQEGEAYDYFDKRMKELKKTSDHVQASKDIGWET